MLRLLLVIGLAMATTIGFSATTIIEDFQDTDDPGNWNLDTTPDQTQNILLNGTLIPEFEAAPPPAGNLIGRFITHWALNDAATSATENVYNSGDGLAYWAARFNINAPTSLPNNTIPTSGGLLLAEIQNDSTYAVQVALVVDSAASSQLERGPLVSIAAGTSVTYTWDFTANPPIGFDTGDGVFTGSEQRVKSLIVYSPVQPTTSSLSIAVDDIRNGAAPDVVMAESPKLLSMVQGTNPGDVVITWEALSDPAITGYDILVGIGDHTNLLSFLVVPASQTSAVLPGFSTNENIYAGVIPTYEEGTVVQTNQFYVGAVRLSADGSAPTDRIVMDADLFTPESPEFVNNDYDTAVVYTAEAFDGLDRTFDFVAAETIENMATTLTPSPDGVVIWSNLRDGETPGTSLNAQSQAAISNFLAADGNLIISGSALAQDIGSTAGLLESLFHASLQSSDVGIPVVVPGGLFSISSFSTALNPVTNDVAYATTANDGIVPTGGSIILATYDGIPAANAVAAIGYEARLVFCGFAIETAGDAAGPAATQALRQNLIGEMIVYLTNQTAAADWQLFR